MIQGKIILLREHSNREHRKRDGILDKQKLIFCPPVLLDRPKLF